MVNVLAIPRKHPEPLRAKTDKPRRTSGAIDWRYSLAELWADGAVHTAGLGFVVIGSTALLAAVRNASGTEIAATVVYLVSLGLSFGASAAYNVWPVSDLKWLLRRFDQSAIYLLIAGTYTPFLAAMNAWGALLGIWSAAALGVALRILRPGHFDRLSVALYLLLGWSGVLMLDEVVSRLPAGAPWLIAAGGVVYSLGVVFHLWNGLRFQNAIWHGFVLVAASIHYAAVWSTVASPA